MKKITICIALTAILLGCKKDRIEKKPLYLTNPTLTYKYGDNILVRDLASGNETIVFSGYTNPMVSPDYPAWSADGKRICFTVDTTDLYTLSVSISPVDGFPIGSNPTKIADGISGGGSYRQGKWRPGANQIACVWKHTGDPYKIHLLPSEGGPVTVIYTGASTDWVVEDDIAFKSDGSSLVFSERQISTGFLFLKVLDVNTKQVIRSIDLSQYRSIKTLDWAKTAGSNMVVIETVPKCDGTQFGNSGIHQLYTVDVNAVSPALSWIKNDAGSVSWLTNDAKLGMQSGSLVRGHAVGSPCSASFYFGIKTYTITNSGLVDDFGVGISIEGYNPDWRR